MKLIVAKTPAALSQAFRVPFENEGWQADVDTPHFTAAPYPLITNQRPVRLQCFEYGFFLYLGDEQTLLKRIPTAGVEQVFEKPAFACVKTQRCLIPLTSFCTIDTQTRKEVEVSIPDSSLLYAAGIYETVTTKEGEQVNTFLLLTQPLLHPAIKRIPYLLENGAHRSWLQEGPIAEDYFSSLKPFDVSRLALKPRS
ncbi:MAG: SOS response-associated peptidase family protein [Bacteroidota bacterium]